MMYEMEFIPRLTDRELQTLDHLAQGLMIKEIAAQLGISVKRVEQLLQSIRRKLDVDSNIEAVACAKQHFMLSPERDNVQAIRQHWDSINLHSPNEFVASMSEDGVWKSDTLPKLAQGHEAIRESVQIYFDAFPDIKVVTERIVCNGNEGTVYWRAEGTQQGEFLGIAPSYRRGSVRACTNLKFDEGKISYMRDYWDMNSLLEQMGITRLQKQNHV